MKIAKLNSISISFFCLHSYFRMTNCNMSIHYSKNTVQSIWVKWSYPKLMRISSQTVMWKGRMRMQICCLMYVSWVRIFCWDLCIHNKYRISFAACQTLFFSFFSSSSCSSWFSLSFLVFCQVSTRVAMFSLYFPFDSFLVHTKFITSTWYKRVEEFRAWNRSLHCFPQCIYISLLLLCTKNYWFGCHSNDTFFNYLFIKKNCLTSFQLEPIDNTIHTMVFGLKFFLVKCKIY